MTARVGRRFAVAYVLVTAACGASAAPPADTTARPPAGSAIADTVTVAVPLALPAQLYVEHDAVVYARSTGLIQSVDADLGAPVRAGSLLAQLEDTQQTIRLARMQDSLDMLSRAAARVRELAGRGGATPADSEQAESELHQAQLNVRQAERDLNLTRVVAPFAGVVSARFARPGRLASPGDSLFRVTALGPLLAAVQVPEADAGALRVGSPVEIVAGSSVAPGRVIRAAPVVDAASGTRRYIVRVVQKPGLLPGAAVTVRVRGSPRRAVAVPAAAIGADGFALVWANGRATARAVTTGADLPGGRVEVLRGLAPGEVVLHSAP